LKTSKVCVIGAGLTGLVTAYRLLKKGYDVTILESTLAPGGMVSSFSMGWEKIEHIYHHIFTSDTFVTGLAEELGLTDQIQWLEPKNALYIDNKLYPFTSPFDLVRLDAIPFHERIRTGLAVLKAKNITDITPLENMTAKDWLLARSGPKSYEKLWKPLLKSKFDSDSSDVSAVWIWNKFKLRGNSRKSGIKNEMLGYMDGSFGTLINILTKSVEDEGGIIRYGYTALNITREYNESGGKYFNIGCVLEDCSSVVYKAESIIATVSGVRFANMTSDLKLDKKYLDKIYKLKYKCDLCMVLRLKEKLSDYYWTTICENSPFIVVVEHTNLTTLRRYGGHVVYLSRYLDISDPLWMESDSEIYKLFCNGLKNIYPDFKMSDVKDWRLTRTRYAQPVVGKNYSDNMPEMKTPEDGLFLAGMAQIYPEDRGMNYAIRLANDACESVIKYFDKDDTET